MLNKVCSFIRQQGLINRGDTVVCALSGGADSVALLYALYLLRDRLGIRDRRDWKMPPGRQDMPSCAPSPAKLPQPTQQMTTQRRC